MRGGWEAAACPLGRGRYHRAEANRFPGRACGRRRVARQRGLSAAPDDGSPQRSAREGVRQGGVGRSRRAPPGALAGDRHRQRRDAQHLRNGLYGVARLRGPCARARRLRPTGDAVQLPVLGGDGAAGPQPGHADGEDLRPGTEAQSDTPDVDFISMPGSPTVVARQRAGGPRRRDRDPEPGRDGERLRGRRLPGGGRGRGRADPARHVSVRAEVGARAGRGRRRRDHLQRRRHAGPAERRVHRQPDRRDRSGRDLELRPRQGALRRLPGGPEPDRRLPDVRPPGGPVLQPGDRGDRRGDPNNVVVVGAHLDSVAAGPGINDDGSGTSLLLTMAQRLARPGTR